MKYSDLPRKWQKIALQMDDDFVSEGVAELTEIEEAESGGATEKGIAAPDALEDREYEIITDKEGKEKLIKV